MKKIINTVFIIGTISLLFDLIVSYAVFINATDYFLKNELNRYMILEFQQYNLFQILIRDLIFPFAVISLSLFLWFETVKRYSSVNKNLIIVLKSMILIFLLLYTFIHIIGVLSWLF